MPHDLDIAHQERPEHTFSPPVLLGSVDHCQLTDSRVSLEGVHGLAHEQSASLPVHRLDVHFHGHLLFQAQKAHMLQIARLANGDRISDAPCTRAYQYVSHQRAKRAFFEMVFAHLQRFLLEYDLLAIILPDLPLSLHFLDLDVHLFLHLHSFLDFLDFFIKASVKLRNMSLCTVYILLVERLEFEDLLFELDVELIHMI